jgi:transcription termination factor NusB
VAASLDKLLENVQTHYQDLEQLEQRLASLEDKLVAISRARQNDEQLFEARRDLDSQLRAYRGKMSAEQLSMLEKQFLERRLLEQARLPRLSLFYLR